MQRVPYVAALIIAISLLTRETEAQQATSDSCNWIQSNANLAGEINIGNGADLSREECIIAVSNYDGDKKCDIANVDENSNTCWCQFGDDTTTDETNIFTCFLDEYCTEHPDKCKDPEETECLNREPNCYQITDRNTCLNAKDGRNVGTFLDDPCVWCGGGKCTSNKAYKCEPETWLAAQPNQVEQEKFEYARDTCSKKDCKAFDIDAYLLDCSEEFSSSSGDLEKISEKVGDLDDKLKTVEGDIKGLKTKDVSLDTQIKAVDTKLGKVDEALKKKVDDVKDGLDGDIDDLQSQLDSAKLRIQALEDTLKGFEKRSSAQAAVGSVDLLDTNQPSVMSNVSQNTLIICLVVFNIGTILGCISCLFWSKRGGAKGYVSKVVYDGVSNFDEEEVKN